MNKKFIKQALSTLLSMTMLISPISIMAEENIETVSEVISAENTVTVNADVKYPGWNEDNWFNGVQFGRLDINLMRRPAYVYFDLHDISAIEKLDLKFKTDTADTSKQIKIQSYDITTEMPEIGDITVYGPESQEYADWNTYVTTQLTTLESALTFTPDSTKYAESEITSLINGTDKAEGYLVLKLVGVGNFYTYFKESTLTITYNKAELEQSQQSYLSAVNEAGNNTEMRNALTKSAATYFDVDLNALFDMSLVYSALADKLKAVGFSYTKESFKTAFDTEVAKYLKTEEVEINKFVFNTKNTSVDFGTKSTFNANTQHVFVGAKLDNTAAIKNITLNMYTNLNNPSPERSLLIPNVYLIDSFNTGENRIYNAPAADEAANEIYAMWNNFTVKQESQNVIGGVTASTQSNAQKVARIIASGAAGMKSADITDYVCHTLNNYGKDKYLFLHLNCGNIDFVTGLDNNAKIPKFTVVYDTTKTDDIKQDGYSAIIESMNKQELKDAIETYGDVMGIGFFTELAKDYAYDDLLSALESVNSYNELIDKAGEIYQKYVTVRSITPEDEMTYNQNWGQLQPTDGRTWNVLRYISQYVSADFGNGQNILNAEYRINSSEENTYSGNFFIRTIKPVVFEGFNPANTYQIVPIGNNSEVNAAAAAALDSDMTGDYNNNTKGVARIKLSSGANASNADITDNLKEQLSNGASKIAYTMATGSMAYYDRNADGKCSEISVTFDRTYRNDEALEALRNANGSVGIKNALNEYSIEFGVTGEKLAVLDNYSTIVETELLETLKNTVYASALEVEDKFDSLVENAGVNAIKFETTDCSYENGSLSAQIKKLSAYSENVTVVFATYKNESLVNVVIPGNVQSLIDAQRDEVKTISEDVVLDEYDNVKVIVIDGFANLEPLARVYGE